MEGRKHHRRVLSGLYLVVRPKRPFADVTTSYFLREPKATGPGKMTGWALVSIQKGNQSLPVGVSSEAATQAMLPPPPHHLQIGPGQATLGSGTVLPATK